VQARLNGELGAQLHDGIAAAVVSFGTGLVVLAVLVPALPAGRRGVARLRAALRNGSLRWWQCLGGVCGAVFVAGQGLSAAALGVVVFTVLTVAGQAVSGLLVDRHGLGPAGVQPVTGVRLAGAALAVAAVALAGAGGFAAPDAAALVVVPVVAGALVAWQQAVNGRIRQAAGAWPTTLLNFATGTVALLLAFGVDLAARGWPSGAPPGNPLLYAGGVLGVLFVAAAAALVRVTGVLLFGLAALAGQVLGAAVLDLAAPPATGRPGVAAFAAVGLTAVAVGIAALPPRLRTTRAGRARPPGGGTGSPTAGRPAGRTGGPARTPGRRWAGRR